MNTTTGLVYHEDYLKHDTGTHPESAERLVSIMQKLEGTGIIEKLNRITPIKASKDQIRYVHRDAHISRVKRYVRGAGACSTLIHRYARIAVK